MFSQLWAGIKGFFTTAWILQWIMRKYDEWQLGKKRKAEQKAKEDLEIARANAARGSINSVDDMPDDDFRD